MRKIYFRLGLILLAVIFLGQTRDLQIGPAPGETAPVQPAWLYVIGINDYKFVPKLDTAVADAKAVRDLLLSKYQFSRDRLLERYNAEATRENIIQDLLDLTDKLSREDSLLIYYAGHGYEEKRLNQGYWVPVDGQNGKISTFISNADIRTALSGIPARHIWLVSDSCFSGSLLAERSLTDPINDRYYRNKYQLPSRQVLTSGGVEPVADASGSPDCRGHSVFACYFLKFLAANPNPYLTPSEVYTGVARNVSVNSRQTPLAGPLRDSGDENGEFVLIARQGGLPQDSGHVPLPTPAYTGTDTSALVEAEKRDKERQEAEKRRQQQLETDKKKYFADLEAYYSKLTQLDKSITLTPAEKAALWQDFLGKFPENHSTFGPNPRAQYAKERIAYWQKQAPPPGRLESNAPGAPAGMARIPAGCFMMGCAPGDGQCGDDEKPRHEVCLDAFSMDATEVTKKDYEECVRVGKCRQAHYNDSSCWVWTGRTLGGPDHPVVCVAWEEANIYCTWSGKRLPTDAEWEYAARAGTNSIYYWGNQFDGSYAWYSDNSSISGKETNAVGTRKPNSWGLYDMVGNVWEWVADWYGSDYYASAPRDNPKGPQNGTRRILRGASWYDNPPHYLRLSDRNAEPPSQPFNNLGFRCAGD